MRKTRIAMLAVFAALGGLISRWHGGGFFKAPKVLINTIWSLPFAYVVYQAHAGYWAIVWAAVAVVFFLTFAGKATGHGGGMDLGHNPKEPGEGRDPEKLEWFLIWAHDDLPRYWYDVALMVLIGFAGSVGAAVAVGLVNPFAGIVIAAGGALKGPAYMIGWRVFPKGQGEGHKEFDEATELGEFLSGVFAFAGLGIAYLLLKGFS